jgi:hypothetical protein
VALGNLTDFGYKCRYCNTINTITLEDGELKKQKYTLSKVENLNRREWLIANINSSMSNDTEKKDRDREIDILK